MIDGYVREFVSKLYRILEQQQSFIAWSRDGSFFNVYDTSAFEKHVLPLYYKHKNFASFIRQLNMYGFKKLTFAPSHEYSFGVSFKHVFFKKGSPDLLKNITRKLPRNYTFTSEPLRFESKKSIEKSGLKEDGVRLLFEKVEVLSATVTDLVKAHESVLHDLMVMKSVRDNISLALKSFHSITRRSNVPLSPPITEEYIRLPRLQAIMKWKSSVELAPIMMADVKRVSVEDLLI